MLRSLRLGLLAALAITAVPQLARAGCGGVCDIRLSSVAVEPPLACLKVTADENGCGCHFRVSFHNECSSPIEVQAPFDGCSDSTQTPPTSIQPCFAIPPLESAAVREDLESNGTHAFTRDVLVDGATHRVSLTATVINYDAHPGGIGCAFTPRTENAAPLAILFVAALTLRRRRN